jgi:hypothetical protein
VGKVPLLLKAFVIGGGVVLIAGTVLLVVMLRQRLDGAPTAATPAAAGPVDLALPAKARIEQMVLDGSRLAVLAAGPDGQQYLAVINALTGERLSLIRVRAGP